MFAAVTLPLVALLIGFPGLPKLPGFGLKDLKKLRDKPAAPLDTLPPAWKTASRLALENQFVLGALPPLGPHPVGLRLNQDPRTLRVRFDPDSGAVSLEAQVGEFTVGDARRVPLDDFTHELTRRNFARLWAERNRLGLQSSTTPTGVAPRSGLSFELPSPLPKRIQSLLGPGGPSLTVSGSENIRLSGQSSWTNQQIGYLGQRRSLFPSLDMQQDLDIRLEGRLSDRVGVNLLQNSANQVPLANRIAINYKGDEDDLVQALDLGNTNLTLPGTQFVSYSGRNEGLFGMKATTRLGPLDFTVLASKQEGRSERASYAGGSSRQTQLLGDKDYVKGVYFFLYDPNLPARDIDESSVRLYLDEGFNASAVNLVRGRAFENPDPGSLCLDSLRCPDGPDPDTKPDTTRSVRGNFRLLKAGADQDFEILNDVYGPLYKVVRLRSALTGESQRLAVTYRYKNAPSGTAVGDSIHVGGESQLDTDGAPALHMMLLRVPTSELAVTPEGFYDPEGPFAGVRDLELKNFYQLAGSRIDPKTFEMSVWQGDDQPPATIVRQGLPYIEVVGLDNFDETKGYVDLNQKGHDGRVDGTTPTTNLRSFVDFERGTLFFPDLRPFAPRLMGAEARPFERYISSLLARGDSLVGAPPVQGSNLEPNAANPAIYDKRTLISSDRTYSIEVKFTAARAGNEISLGRTNILEGSDVVTINGQALQRDKDYRIDYDLGRVTLIRQLGPADQLNIDYGYAPLFQQAGRTLIGNAFRWEGRDRSFGGAFLYESKGAQDLRPRLGEEPARTLIGDLNTEWKFRPDWVTRLVDALPGVRTTAASELNIQAEMGASYPNPNTRNEVFLDDMEGTRDAVSLSMGPERWRWTSVPQRNDFVTVDDPSALNPQRNAEIHWYSPLNVVRERDMKPSLTEGQGALNSRQVLAISLPKRPRNADPTQKLWAGLTYPLDPVGVDLSRSQFIEIWVNDFRDRHRGFQEDRVRGRNVKLHVDLGAVSEDQQRAPNLAPNRALDSEDLNPRDNELIVTDEKNEDTGVDNRLSPRRATAQTPAEAPDSLPDLVTVDPVNDPLGDDFSQPNDDFHDWHPRKWLFTNGTEDNKNVIPVPETEDLNLNNALDVQQSYFEYTIDLGDTAHRYLVTDVYRSFSTIVSSGDPVPEDNGWRRYRIPIADSAAVRIGSPDLTLARHVRIWVEDVVETDAPERGVVDDKPDARPFLAIGGVDIVGSRWLAADLDAVSLGSGTTITLNTVNSVDNADIYVPPFDPGKTRSGSQELVRREQSLALEFTNLGTDTVEVFKTFSLDEDYSRYGKLNFYAAGYGIPTYDDSTDALDYFVRFSSDEKGLNYYEYRSRVPRTAAAGVAWQEISLTLTDLSNLKLNPDFPQTGEILYRAPGRNPGEQYVIRGRPSFTRLRRISFGLINASGKVFPSGQVWLNEMRAIDVAKDRGQAKRVSVTGRVSNLISNFSLLWNGRDSDFQGVGETRGRGSTEDQIQFSSVVDLHRFFESTRILMPLTFNYSRSQSSPRFTAGDDVVRGGALAEASDSHSESRGFSLSYSRNWGEGAHPLLRYSLGGVTANISQMRSDSRDPLTLGGSQNTNGAVNYNISPRQLMPVPIPGTKLNFFPLPERFYWNYSVQSNSDERFERRFDSTGTRVPRYSTQGRRATVEFGADTRPLDFFHHGFTATRNLSLANPLLERVAGVNFGRVVRWSQNMDARYSVQKLGPWLRPSITWNSRYSQDNGPELSSNLSVRAINNNQQINLNWDLPFDKLVTGMAPTAPAPRDTAKQGARRGGGGWRGLLSRLGPLNTDASFSSSSSHNRMFGTADFFYLMGFKQNPGLGDSTSAVRKAFGYTSSETQDWRAGARTTLNLGFGATVLTRGDISMNRRLSNGVMNRSQRMRFPDLDVNYGKVAELIGLNRIFVRPILKTLYNRSQNVDFINSDKATSVSTSSEWRPLIELSGDLKNGTRCQMRVERRATVTENRQLGNSLTRDSNTNLNLGVNRSYSKGQKVNILGKEATVRSSVNLGLTAAYELQDGETVQAGALPQNQKKQDRLSVNAQGGYSFSNNVTGNLELGFGQNRDLLRDVVTRTMRVELRAQFTF